MLHFWRDAPLTGKEFALLDAVAIAHSRSAMRSNASTSALKNAAGGSGSFEMALCSAILTLGGKHAPIAKIHRFLDQPIATLLDVVEGKICDQKHVEGWGNSFHKGVPDPDWVKVDEALAEFPEMQDKLLSVTTMLHSYNKMVFPNAGAYTAATAVVVGLPAEIASFLLINARLPVWASQAQKEL